MLRPLGRLLRETRAAAAAEFALVLPLLVVMLFFFWEYGRFVEGTHAVTKAARDGVRYAARQRWQDYDCGGSALGGTLDKEAIRRHVVRSLAAWQATTSQVTVNYTCFNSFTGIYVGQVGGAPVVEVSVSVPYQTLFGGLTGAFGLDLNARAESAVMGV